MRRWMVVVGMALALSACVSADMRQYGSVDHSERSMTVPPGGDLAADLKDILNRRGWTLVVDRGPNAIEGKVGESVSLKSYSTYNTRYRLLLRFARFDTCIGHMDGAYRYNLSVIDNKDGKELMVMGGTACASQIKEKFEAFLNSGSN